MMRENGVRSFCTIPLTTALRRLGSLGFGSLTRTRYQEADLHFMQQVANQVAVAVDNVLHDEGVRSAQQALTRERDRLQLLLEVNNAVVSRLDLDQVFASVSGFLRRLIPHEHSSLLLYEPETRQYRKHVPVIAGNEVVVKDCQIDAQWAKSPAGIAITTKRAAVFNEQDLRSARGGLEDCGMHYRSGVQDRLQRADPLARSLARGVEPRQRTAWRPLQRTMWSCWVRWPSR